jgi:hypothetical protein
MPYLDDINVPEPVGTGPINTNVANGARASSTPHCGLSERSGR